MSVLFFIPQSKTSKICRELTELMEKQIPAYYEEMVKRCFFFEMQ